MAYKYRYSPLHFAPVYEKPEDVPADDRSIRYAAGELRGSRQTTCFKFVDHTGHDFKTGLTPFIPGYTTYINGAAASYWPRLCSQSVLHASAELPDALTYVPYRNRNHMAQCLLVRGRPVVGDRYDKYGFRSLDVLRALSPDEVFTILVHYYRYSPQGATRICDRLFRPTSTGRAGRYGIVTLGEDVPRRKQSRRW
jgi:hypothetical protein